MDHSPGNDDDRSSPSIMRSSPPAGNAYNSTKPITEGNSYMNGVTSGYTLMVAGQRTGKTSFLRLILDTCDISQTATKDQLASVAKFVQGCSGHTSHIRTASIDVDLDADNTGVPQRLNLSLVDTPSLDFQDESASERLVSEMLRLIETRLAEGMEDVDDWNSPSVDHHVHLCIYFLNPDHIVPPSVTVPPAPLGPRARANSFSHHHQGGGEQEPVILEPPVTTNPLLYRPTLPKAEINTIRRLSARVNVLPVIARADTLSNDRLAAVKLAVRRDLAEAGIGFGIFDVDSQHSYHHHHHHLPDQHGTINGDSAPNGGYSSLTNGSGSSPSSTSPTTTASLLRLPYALISPDMYSHSEGIARIPLSRHELVRQYTPSPNNTSSKLIRGRFVRSYRWGSMDVLEPNHSDFMPLRNAIFHHMKTLQEYTRAYLLDRFKREYHRHQPPATHHSSMPRHLGQSQGGGGGALSGRSPLPSLRPIQTIDAAPPPPPHPSAHAAHAINNRHPSLSMGHDMSIGGAGGSGAGDHLRSATAAALGRARADSMSGVSSSKGTPIVIKSSKQRTKKITVACNFCRSRKLKCDGGRPACSQCIKRSNPCDYMPHSKRRNTIRQRKSGAGGADESGGDNNNSDSGGEDRSEPSLSPEVPSLPLSRKSSNLEKLGEPGGLGSLGHPPVPPLPVDRHEDEKVPVLPMPVLSAPSSSAEGGLFKDNELPHIATLSLPSESSPPGSATGTTHSHHALAPIRPASEHQAAQRKRAVTLGSKGSRQTSNSGPKVVACNFCRARKTKCDGAHPTCSSCARRSLPCNYVHEALSVNGQGQKKVPRRASTSKLESSSNRASPPPPLPLSANGAMASAGAGVASASTTCSGNGSLDSGYGPKERERESADESGGDMKRPLDELDGVQPQKKMKVDDGSPPIHAIP